jgi:uncharacterized RDD family membrane protein YckC
MTSTRPIVEVLHRRDNPSEPPMGWVECPVAGPVPVGEDWADTFKGHAYAGFWLRLAAYLLDWVLVGLVLAFGVLLYEALQHDDAEALVYVVGKVGAVEVWLAWAYFALMESSPLQATLGKLAVGIYVTDKNGDPIAFARASIRYWLKILSTWTLMIGWLMAAFTPRKRALHDVLAGTLVLKRATLYVTPIESELAAPLHGEHWDGAQWVLPADVKTAPPTG